MTKKADNLRAELIRNFNNIAVEHQVRDPHYETFAARLAIGTVARKLGASIDTVSPGKRSSPYHFHHAQEELFIILDGEGMIRVDGELLSIVAGDVIFIPPGPKYAHQIVNTSSNDLKYISVSTRDYPEICEYPDSEKYAALSEPEKGRPKFHAIHRHGDSLDYWDGEP